MQTFHFLWNIKTTYLLHIKIAQNLHTSNQANIKNINNDIHVNTENKNNYVNEQISPTKT